MADPRRRGRGRSGRGGRIPKKGEAQTSVQNFGESFVSFPLEVSGPIQVNTALSGAAVEALMRDTLARERQQAAALEALHERSGDPALADVRSQIDRHREALEQLARTLGADLSGGEDGGPNGAGTPDAVTLQQLARLNWLALQKAAYASGDHRIDRAVKPVLRDKQRHADVLEGLAARQAVSRLFPEPEE